MEIYIQQVVVSVSYIIFGLTVVKNNVFLFNFYSRYIHSSYFLEAAVW